MLPVPGNRTDTRAWWVLKYYANTHCWGRGCLTLFWEIRENILKEVTSKLKESVIEGMPEVRTRNEHHKIRLEVESWHHGWLCWTHPPKLQWSSHFPGRNISCRDRDDYPETLNSWHNLVHSGHATSMYQPGREETAFSTSKLCSQNLVTKGN